MLMVRGCRVRHHAPPNVDFETRHAEAHRRSSGRRQESGDGRVTAGGGSECDGDMTFIPHLSGYQPSVVNACLHKDWSWTHEESLLGWFSCGTIVFATDAENSWNSQGVYRLRLLARAAVRITGAGGSSFIVVVG